MWVMMPFVHGKLRRTTNQAPAQILESSYRVHLTSVRCTHRANIESPTFPASDQVQYRQDALSTCQNGCSTDDALLKYRKWKMTSRLATDLGIRSRNAKPQGR